MNPFTKFISQRIQNRSLKKFIRDWDIVEHLVVSTYRNEGTPEDSALWQKTRSRLIDGYPQWKSALAPYWPKALVGGAPAIEDPFLALLAYQQVEDFKENWRAMQTLPAAREALNQLIVSLSG
jgi:hypothetical protein